MCSDEVEDGHREEVKGEDKARAHGGEAEEEDPVAVVAAVWIESGPDVLLASPEQEDEAFEEYERPKEHGRPDFRPRQTLHAVELGDLRHCSKNEQHQPEDGVLLEIFQTASPSCRLSVAKTVRHKGSRGSTWRSLYNCLKNERGKDGERVEDTNDGRAS